MSEQHRPERCFRGAGSALLLTTLVACGGATAESAPKSPSSTEPGSSMAEPQTVEEAQAELERARAALSGNGGLAAAGATPSASSTPTSGTSQPDRPAPSPVAPEVAPQGGGAQALSTCDQVCRAVTSMHHAKEAICRLAGPTDTRCADAQKKVADGDAQAASCTCPMSKKS